LGQGGTHWFASQAFQSLNVLLEWLADDTTYDLMDISATDDTFPCSEFSKVHGFHITMGWIHLCVLGILGCITLFSGLTQPMIQSKAKGDTWIHVIEF
jgi:hypothetical protein